MKLIMFLLSLIVTLIVANFVVGYFYKPEIFNVSYKEHRFSKNPLLVYELIPDQGSINSKGFRDYEYEYEKAADTVRIVVIGDSITYGLGVELNQTYPKILERQLCRQEILNTEQKVFQVLNMGVQGYCTIQEVEWLRVKGMQFDPDFIILGYFINDESLFSYDLDWLMKSLDEADRKTQFRHYFPQMSFFEKLYYRSPLGLFILSRLEALRKKEWFRNFESYFRTEPDDVKDPLKVYYEQENVLRSSFEKLKNILDANDLDCLTVVFPDNRDLNDYSREEQHARVLSEAERFGFYGLDMAAYFREKYAELSNEELFIDFCHLTPRGHEIAARAILAKLLEIGVVRSNDADSH